MAGRVDIVQGVLPPGWPEAARVLTVAFGIGLIWLSRSLAQTPATRLAARGRSRRRFRGRASREGPRLRGGGDLAATPRRARPLAEPLRRARRPRERPAAARPRSSPRGDCGSRRRSGDPRHRAVAPHRLTTSPRPRGRLRLSRALLLASSALGHAVVADRGGAANGAGAGGRVRDRQPFVLRPAPRQELSLLAVASRFPRLPRRRGNCPRQRRPGRRRGGDRRPPRRAAPARPRERLAIRGRRRLRRAPRALSRARAASPCRSGRRPCSTRASSRSRDGRSARCASPSLGSGRRVTRSASWRQTRSRRLWRPSSRTSRLRGACGEPERGFSMAIDDLHVPGTVLALAEDAEGRVGGFLHLAPSLVGGGWSLSAMRRRPDAPNGLTEFLVVEALAWAREHRRERALTQLLRADGLPRSRPGEDAGRGGSSAAGSCSPTTSSSSSGSTRSTGSSSRSGGRRYICVERLTDLPARRARVSPRRVLARAARPLDAQARDPPAPGLRQTRRVAFWQ